MKLEQTLVESLSSLNFPQFATTVKQLPNLKTTNVIHLPKESAQLRDVAGLNVDMWVKETDDSIFLIAKINKKEQKQ